MQASPDIWDALAILIWQSAAWPRDGQVVTFDQLWSFFLFSFLLPSGQSRRSNMCRIRLSQGEVEKETKKKTVSHGIETFVAGLC